jgi:hypothetical protein
VVRLREDGDGRGAGRGVGARLRAASRSASKRPLLGEARLISATSRRRAPGGAAARPVRRRATKSTGAERERRRSRSSASSRSGDPRRAGGGGRRRCGRGSCRSCARSWRTTSRRAARGLDEGADPGGGVAVLDRLLCQLDAVAHRGGEAGDVEPGGRLREHEVADAPWGLRPAKMARTMAAFSFASPPSIASKGWTSRPSSNGEMVRCVTHPRGPRRSWWGQ